MKLSIDLKSLQDENGHYSENDVKELERLTGKSWQQLHAEAETQTTPDIPKGNPANWRQSQKLAFIKENGREAYKNLIDERK
jgi:hypothetical protein